MFQTITYIMSNMLIFYFTYRTFHPDVIVQSAMSKIGVVGYNIVYSNCEHFATWCRYGISMSQQVNTCNMHYICNYYITKSKY